MSNLLTGYAEGGLAHPKFVRYRVSNGAIWNTSGTPAFEVYNAAHIVAYGIAATEGPPGRYTATDPADPTAGDYQLIAAVGSSLAVSDLTAGLRWQDAAGRLGVDVRAINGVTLEGTGVISDPWGPA